MTRLEYLRTIASLLQDISEEDRKDAMKFYNDYFDEAGEDNADEAIKELGSPEEVADKIRESLGLGPVSSNTAAASANNVAYNNINHQYYQSPVQSEKKKFPGWAIALIVIGVLLICTVPFLIAVFSLNVAFSGGKETLSSVIVNDGFDDDTDLVDIKDLDTKISADNVKNLEIEIGACELSIVSSDSKDFRFECSRVISTKKKVVRLDGSTLKIKYEEKKNTFTSTPHFTLYVPENMNFEKVSISLGAGNLVIDELISTKDLDINLGAGNLEIYDLTAEDVNVKCGCGNVELYGNIVGDLDAELGLGNITMELDGTESDHNYDISCVMGDVTIGNNEYSGLSSSRFMDNDAKSDFSIDCALGNIEIFFK